MFKNRLKTLTAQTRVKKWATTVQETSSVQKACHSDT